MVPGRFTGRAMGERTRGGAWLAIAALGIAALTLAACASSDAGASVGADRAGTADGVADGLADGAFVRVVTTVSPLRNIVENVGGDRVRVVGLVPEGTNSHTFEPAPSAAQALTTADLVVLNGLNLELPAREMAQANVREGTVILLLGENAIAPDDYVFDFSFPRDQGDPNPHLWTAPNLAIRYAALVRDALSTLDTDGATYYAANFDRFRARVEAMDAAFTEVLGTIPVANRKLLTYHDSFPYFGPRYGLEIIGAIQPSDFSEPSPLDLSEPSSVEAAFFAFLSSFCLFLAFLAVAEWMQDCLTGNENSYLQDGVWGGGHFCCKY